MNSVDILILSVLGGVLGLDTVSFPQAMLSRPIVGATLAGAILGDPWSGLLVGATLELFAVETLPFGASRYPEWGSAGVAGGALFAKAAYGFEAGRLTTSVLAALALAWFGGWSMVQLRKLNAHWARTRHEAVATGSRQTVIGLQIAGLGADFARGVILTALGLSALAPLQVFVLQAWGSGAPLSRAVVAGAAGAVALGAVWKLFHAVPRFFWHFLVGVVAGLVVVNVS
jgi:mannose/fructose/N-acetylgalactosamine-specific phosphotransferase system component IIC